MKSVYFFEHLWTFGLRLSTIMFLMLVDLPISGASLTYYLQSILDDSVETVSSKEDISLYMSGHKSWHQSTHETAMMLAPQGNDDISATLEDPRDSTLYRVIYHGKEGPGKGKNIVFISSDHEYRGEESLPALAKILAKRYGFTCTVIWALDQAGNIHPGGSNIKGLGVLKDTDLMVIFTRFSNFSDDQMQHIDDYLRRGGPVVGLRTSTHAFRNNDSPNWNHYDYKYEGSKTEWHRGFGELVLGETWVGHYGKNHEQASKIIIEPEQINHPIMRGVKNAWAQCGGYKAFPEGTDLKILARGQVLNGMSADSEPDETKEQLPIAWVRTYQLPSGAPGRAFTTTHGASEDLLSEGFRRMLINACLWAVGSETIITGRNNINFVGKYIPTTFNFDGYKAGVKPAHLRKWRSLIMPGEVVKKQKK